MADYSGKLVTASYTIYREQKDAIDKAARERLTNASNMLRIILDEWLKRNEAGE